MSAAWEPLTLPQAVVVFALLLVSAQAVGAAYLAVQRWRGKPVGDHCEHCDVIEDLGERLDKLVAFAEDTFAVQAQAADTIAELRDAPERAA